MKEGKRKEEGKSRTDSLIFSEAVVLWHLEPNSSRIKGEKVSTMDALCVKPRKAQKGSLKTQA